MMKPATIQPYTGGCACGAIRYEVEAEPAQMGDCHCRQCQRDSGTGHGSHLTFVGAPVKIVGEAGTWIAVGENGTRKRRAFCRTCGAPVYLEFPDMPEVFVASAASLDEPERYRPQSVCWTSAAQHWDSIDPALDDFEKMPPAASG
jgi:hypothetical protein